MPKLIVTKGSDAGKQFPLTTTHVTIGRHSGNTVALLDQRVSRRHLELRSTPSGGYQLFDLQSGNGTQVNGRLVQVIDLRSGDEIAIGETILQYVESASTSSAPVEAPPALSGTRLVVRPPGDQPSAILRSVAADAGSQILSRPDRATTDWLRTRLASLAVLYEATSAVSQILDVDELLHRILMLILRTAEADHGCFLLIDRESGALVPKATRSRDLPLGSSELVVSRTVVDHVLKEGKGILVADAGTDERFRGHESISRHQIREVICVPMKGRHETVGVLFLDTKVHPSDVPDPSEVDYGTGSALPPEPRKFTPDHLTLAIAVAHQAALAVEETRYYQALVQAERLAAVGQTIAALSHHIKNIMQGVRFGSDMVRMALNSDDKDLLLKGWRLVEKNQGKIDHLILDMLSYSKDREPAIEPTDLNVLVDDVLDVVRGRAAEAGIKLQYVPTQGLTSIPCDPDGIHRALLNIVSNAVDAVDEQPEPMVSVTTRLTADGRFAEILVCDNGPGIPRESLGDIFRPFVSTKGARGTGLGLPVSRKVLREHGGDVLVESTIGEGTQFLLRIPTEDQSRSKTVFE